VFKSFGLPVEYVFVTPPTVLKIPEPNDGVLTPVAVAASFTIELKSHFAIND
jgi:hypothetical protein